VLNTCFECGCEVEDGWWYDEEKTIWIGISCGCDDEITVDRA